MRAAPAVVVLSILLVAGLAWAAPWVPARARPGDGFQRGVALGMWAWEDDHDYAWQLDEIVATGATDVELALTWTQQEMTSTVVKPWRGYSPTDETLRRTLRQARERGLRVLLLPIVRIHNRKQGEWRGKLEFKNGGDMDAWWRSYSEFIMTMAAAARDEGAARLSVGSELVKLETDRARWSGLVRRVRAVFPGKLMYSANWDHYEPVTFWDLLDEAGVTSYYELTKSHAPSLGDLQQAWSRWLPAVERFSQRVGKPVIITEIGYPSLDGANNYPWDETRKAPVDLEEQRLCYQAFRTTVGTSPRLSGVYFWNWFGTGGLTDGDYTPRGKPAVEEIRAFFREPSLGPR
jgi:hypothetical protein